MDTSHGVLMETVMQNPQMALSEKYRNLRTGLFLREVDNLGVKNAVDMILTGTPRARPLKAEDFPPVAPKGSLIFLIDKEEVFEDDVRFDFFKPWHGRSDDGKLKKPKYDYLPVGKYGLHGALKTIRGQHPRIQGLKRVIWCLVDNEKRMTSNMLVQYIFERSGITPGDAPGRRKKTSNYGYNERIEINREPAQYSRPPPPPMLPTNTMERTATVCRPSTVIVDPQQPTTSRTIFGEVKPIPQPVQQEIEKSQEVTVVIQEEAETPPPPPFIVFTFKYCGQVPSMFRSRKIIQCCSICRKFVSFFLPEEFNVKTAHVAEHCAGLLFPCLSCPEEIFDSIKTYHKHLEEKHDAVPRARMPIFRNPSEAAILSNFIRQSFPQNSIEATIVAMEQNDAPMKNLMFVDATGSGIPPKLLSYEKEQKPTSLILEEETTNIFPVVVKTEEPAGEPAGPSISQSSLIDSTISETVEWSRLYFQSTTERNVAPRVEGGISALDILGPSTSTASTAIKVEQPGLIPAIPVRPTNQMQTGNNGICYGIPPNRFGTGTEVCIICPVNGPRIAYHKFEVEAQMLHALEHTACDSSLWFACAFCRHVETDMPSLFDHIQAEHNGDVAPVFVPRCIHKSDARVFAKAIRTCFPNISFKNMNVTLEERLVPTHPTTGPMIFLLGFPASTRIEQILDAYHRWLVEQALLEREARQAMEQIQREEENGEEVEEEYEPYEEEEDDEEEEEKKRVTRKRAASKKTAQNKNKKRRT